MFIINLMLKFKRNDFLQSFVVLLHLSIKIYWIDCMENFYFSSSRIENSNFDCWEMDIFNDTHYYILAANCVSNLIIADKQFYRIIIGFVLVFDHKSVAEKIINNGYKRHRIFDKTAASCKCKKLWKQLKSKNLSKVFGQRD